MERPQSRLSFNNNNNNNNNNNRTEHLKVDLEKLNLNVGDSNKVNYMCNDNHPTTSNYGGIDEEVSAILLIGGLGIFYTCVLLKIVHSTVLLYFEKKSHQNLPLALQTFCEPI